MVRSSNRHAVHPQPPRRQTNGLRDPKHPALWRLKETHFRVCWLMIFSLLLVDAAFLVGTSVFYNWLLYTPIVKSVEKALHLLPIATLRSLVVGFYLLAFGYVFSVVELFFVCLKQRRQALKTRPRPVVVSEQSPGSNGRVLTSIPVLHHVLSFVALDGKYFEVWFTALEVCEMISQTYQCFLLSWNVTTKWINALAVAFTVINCLSTPMVRLILRENLVGQRIVCVLCDCCLGVVQSVVITFLIFYPYWRAYDPDIGYFPDDLLYIDTWYEETVHQLDQLFIVSYLDFATTVFPHLNVLVSLRSVSRMIQQPVEDRGPNSLMLSLVSVRSTRQCVSSPRRPTPTPGNSRNNQELNKKHLALSLTFAIALVVCHLFASRENPVAKQNCELHPNAWFVTQYACSVVRVNCHRSQIRGLLHETTTMLGVFEPGSVAYLIFAHCPELEIPASFRRFRNLGGLDIFNSTLVSWSAEAAIDAALQPRFHFVTMELVNLTSLPEGMLGDNLPTTFADVELYNTNLSAIPADLGDRWPNLWSLMLELCQLQELPKSLARMPLSYFSVAGNAIASIDQEVLVNGAFAQLVLSDNPIETVDDGIGVLDNLYEFSLEYTELREIPRWIMKFVVDWNDRGEYLEHSVFGTPFCRDSPLVNATSESIVESYRKIACAEDIGSAKGRYPFDMVSSQRPW